MPPKDRTPKKRAKPIRLGSNVTARHRDLDDEALSRIADIRDLRDQADQIGEEVDEVQKAIVADMHAADLKTTTVTVERRGRFHVTLGQSVSKVINEQRLKKRLGQALWMKVTTRTLDKKKLDAFIASGEVDPTVVADCTDEFPGKEYVKVQRKGTA